MAEAHLRLVTDAGSEEKADIVFGRVRDAIEANLQSLKPYHKGGFEACLTVPVPSGRWPEQVVFVIGVAQATGRGWTLTGDIESDVDLLTDDLRFPGLTFANLTHSRT